MLKKVFRILGQVTVIAVITFLLGESVLRIYNHFFPTYIFYSDSYNRFRGKPFAEYFDFKRNSKGFLDRETSAKRDDTYRIVVIADSFGEGVVPYRYNWLNLLESRLNNGKPEKKVEIIKLAIPSIGPPEYLALLIREGLALAPDMVVINFFTGNDFIESKPARRPLYTYSYIISLLNYAAKVGGNMENKIVQQGKMVYCDECPTFDQQSYWSIQKGRSFVYLQGDKRFLKLCDKAVSWLKQIKDICDKRRIKLVVVIAPDELQLNSTLAGEIRSQFFPDKMWDRTQPNRMLAARLENLNINTLDLYPSFAEQGVRQSLYKPRDSHWNRAGNQVAADAVGNYLLGRLGK